MKTITQMLARCNAVSDYKINVRSKESVELFFVKGKLETVRCTDTCDKEVTVYVDHDEYKGEAQFFVYPSTTEQQLQTLIDEAVAKALLIKNQHYTLPEQETGEYAVDSNFSDYAPTALAEQIADTVFAANKVEDATLNSVEIFVNKYTITVANSRGLNKTQVRYDAMVEAIPTYNGEGQSVELYEQYNFGSLDIAALSAEIAGKMDEVKMRSAATKPENPVQCKVILNKLELSELMETLAYDLNYSQQYAQASLYKKGDAIQTDPKGDLLSITMAGTVPGNVRSSKFDADGISLGSMRIIEGGKAVNYFGNNRYGQYLGEVPTGNLPCLCVDAGTAAPSEFAEGPYLEVVSMSGLQVDAYNDYIGGEVRLAYYHDGTAISPVTGISISGKLSDVLNTIRLSTELTVHSGYTGPAKAILDGMTIF